MGVIFAFVMCHSSHRSYPRTRGLVFIKDVAEKHGKKFFRKAAPRGLTIDSTIIAISIFTKKSEQSCHIPFKIFE